MNNFIDFNGFLNIFFIELNKAMKEFFVLYIISGIQSISKNESSEVVHINSKFQLFNFINCSKVNESRNALISVVEDDKIAFNCVASIPISPINNIPILYIASPIKI